MLEQQIKDYKEWCKVNNKRPQDYTSLKEYCDGHLQNK